MFTPMKFKANEINKCYVSSFISFIFSIFSFFNKTLWNSVFKDAVFPGFCGVY